MQKHIKKLPQGRLILPTPTALLFSETLNLTSDIKYNRGIKSEFNKTLWYGPTSFQHFQGALSKDFFHDINLTLEAQNIEKLPQFRLELIISNMKAVRGK